MTTIPNTILGAADVEETTLPTSKPSRVAASLAGSAAIGAGIEGRPDGSQHR